jgi:predicted PurR-regulated permease PerM
MDYLSAGASIVMVLALVAIVVCVTLVICWIVVPFAVVGLKPLVRELIREQQANNKLVQAQLSALEALAVRFESSRPLPPA